MNIITKKSEKKEYNEHGIEIVEPDKWELEAIKKHKEEVANGTAEFFDADEVFKELGIIK